MSMKRDKILRQLICAVLCFILTVSIFPVFLNAAGEDMIEAASADLRSAMTRRASFVTIIHHSDQLLFPEEVLEDDEAFGAAVEKLLQDIYNRAIAHTGVGNEGDYLRWQISSCEEEFHVEYINEGLWAGNYEYTMTFYLYYYTTEEQENDLTAKIRTVLTQMGLQDKTDYEKVKAIYDYICANVEYDFENLNNQEYDLKYSAYAAMVNGKAVCQGYSNLFYRMALEAGVETRIVTGQSSGEPHAWNIVKLDGVWYCLDCTWDAKAAVYRYFLKCDASMTDHEKNPEYTQPEFLEAHPMSGSDYVIPEDPLPTTEPTTVPTTEPTTAPTTEPTTAPTTEPTTVPTTEPTTAPTTEPVTVPTTEPVTVPTTEPTTAPTTEPTTAPTTEPTTVPTTEPTQSTAQATTGTSAAPTTNHGTQPSSPDPEPGKEPAGTVILIVGGLVLLAAAAGTAVLLVRKKRS